MTAKSLDDQLDEFFTCDNFDNRYPLCLHCRKSIKDLIQQQTDKARIDQIMLDELAYSANLDIDESQTIKVRDILLEEIRTNYGQNI